MALRIYDSFAILKLFQKEQGHHKVARLLNQDLKRNETPLLPIINFGEIIYRTKRDFGEQAKLRVIRNVISLGFRLVPASDSRVYAAADLRGSHANNICRQTFPKASPTALTAFDRRLFLWLSWLQINSVDRKRNAYSGNT